MAVEIISSIDKHTIAEIMRRESRDMKRLEPLWGLVSFHLKENLGREYSFSVMDSIETACFESSRYNIVVYYKRRVVASFETSFAERSITKNTRNGIQNRIGKCSDFRNKNVDSIYTTITLYSQFDKSTGKEVDDSNISPERRAGSFRGKDGMPDYTIAAVIDDSGNTIIPSALNGENKRFLRQSNLTVILEDISNVIKDRNE